jgi:ATP-dependent Lon protease
VALRGTQTDAPTPPRVPVVPVRNAVIFPGTLVPLDINRTTSIRALEAAMQSEPRFVAVFAQRAFEIEQPTSQDLHPAGCLCIVRILHRRGPDASPSGAGNEPAPPFAWIFLEGIRAIELEALEQTDPYYVARVANSSIEHGDDRQIAALDRELRELAHRFADTMDRKEQIHALIDQLTEAQQLSDLVMAHFPMPVAEKASYAEETQLSGKLDRAIAVLGTELAKLPAAT